MAVERTVLPGFGLPVNYRPDAYFQNAVLDWSGTILTVRELNMMAIVDKITDKPDWDKKVFDDIILQKWRQEALTTKGMDVSEKMFDWVCTTILETLLSTNKCNASLFAAFLSKERSELIIPTRFSMLSPLSCLFIIITYTHLAFIYSLPSQVLPFPELQNGLPDE